MLCYGYIKVKIRDKRHGDAKRFLDALMGSEYWPFVASLSVDFAYGKCEANIVAASSLGSSVTSCKANIERWLDGVLEPVTGELTDPFDGKPVTYRPFSVYATVPV
jgi:hypothetical protein